MASKKAHIELWKIQRTVDFLENVECKEKRLISLIVGGGVSLNAFKEELSRSPFASDHQVKKWFERIETEFSHFPGRKSPPNGIYFYIAGSSQITTFIHIASEPAFPIPDSSLQAYGKENVILRVERKFFLKPLQELLARNIVKVAFILIDSNGAIVAALKGSKLEVIQRVATMLPRHNKLQLASAMKTLVLKVGQMASQELLDSEGNPIVDHIVIGGTYDFRAEMKPEVMFSEKIRPLVVKLVEISSASEEEVPAALVKAMDKLPSNIRTAEEITMLQEVLNSGAKITGAKEVLEHAEKKLVDRIFIDVSKPLIRFELKSPKDQKVVYEEHPRDFFPYTVVESKELTEWLLDNQTRLGINEIQLITNPNTPEAFKFIHTAEGIAAILRS